MRFTQPRIPRDVVTALSDEGALLSAFRGMRPAVRRDFLQWILVARTAEVRRRRIAELVLKVRAYSDRHNTLIFRTSGNYYFQSGIQFITSVGTRLLRVAPL